MKPKKYTGQTIIGQKGINLIEKIILDMGFVWHPSNLDVGIDGYIEIRDSESGEATNLIIQVQSKAKEHKFPAENENSFECLCDERDLDYWMKGNCPVILICSNVVDNKAYWISVKEYFKDKQKIKSKKIIFQKLRNEFSSKSKVDLIDLVRSSYPGMYFTPPPKEEQLFSNLLPLVKFPEKIYFAETNFRKSKDLWNALNKLVRKSGINKAWILTDGKIYSFNNLSNSPWNQFISERNVDSLNSSKWAYSDEIVLRNNFVQLLNSTFNSFLHYKGIIHKISDKINLFYFKPKLDQSDCPLSKKIHYQRFGRRYRQSVCESYSRKSDPKIISFYRHLAFEARFQRFNKQWFLEITPTYFFSHNGFTTYRYYENKLKGKKALDKAPTVFSETLFWAYYISKEQGELFGRSLFKFSSLWNSTLNAGIDDDMWLVKEDDGTIKDLTTQLKLLL